jgi:hypothetical protein
VAFEECKRERPTSVAVTNAVIALTFLWNHFPESVGTYKCSLQRWCSVHFQYIFIGR